MWHSSLSQGLGGLSRLSNAKTRSISAENFTGEKGKGGMATEGTGKRPARELGQGWKVSPSLPLTAHTTTTIAEIEGPGVIQHIWITCQKESWRTLVIRFYWDGEKEPSVETPLGDMFCNGWCEVVNISSLPVAVNPAGGMNCYWEMPFKKSCKITVENLQDDEPHLVYQITYALTEVPDDAAYFHAQWRRSSPLKYKDVHTVIDGIRGHGHYIGTYMAWQVNNNRWWGEGEIKFYMDGDRDFPTICGTGTEDYFGGAWAFEHPTGNYCAYSTPFLGMPQVIIPDGFNNANLRFGLYRWHVMDPVRFGEDLKVTIQALGWRSKGRFLPLKDDIASVAFWYQAEPHAPFPEFPGKDELEVI